MGKRATIKIKGKPYALEFGYGSVRALGATLGDDTYDGTVMLVVDALQELDNNKENAGNLPFKTLDVIGHLVSVGIVEDHDFSSDKLVEAVLQDVGQMVPIFKEFIKSFPVSKEVVGEVGEKKSKKKTP